MKTPPWKAWKLPPIEFPRMSPNPIGTLKWDHTGVVVVHLAADGSTGLGWTYAACGRGRVDPKYSRRSCHWAIGDGDRRHLGRHAPQPGNAGVPARLDGRRGRRHCSLGPQSEIAGPFARRSVRIGSGRGSDLRQRRVHELHGKAVNRTTRRLGGAGNPPSENENRPRCGGQLAARSHGAGSDRAECRIVRRCQRRVTRANRHWRWPSGSPRIFK